MVDDERMKWTTGRYCDEGGGCVEVAIVKCVGLRDSKDPQSPVLWFTFEEWEAFILGAQAGDFGLG